MTGLVPICALRNTAAEWKTVPPRTGGYQPKVADPRGAEKVKKRDFTHNMFADLEDKNDEFQNIEADFPDLSATSSNIVEEATEKKMMKMPKRKPGEHKRGEEAKWP